MNWILSRMPHVEEVEALLLDAKPRDVLRLARTALVDGLSGRWNGMSSEDRQKWLADIQDRIRRDELRLPELK